MPRTVIILLLSWSCAWVAGGCLSRSTKPRAVGNSASLRLGCQRLDDTEAIRRAAISRPLQVAARPRGSDSCWRLEADSAAGRTPAPTALAERWRDQVVRRPVMRWLMAPFADLTDAIRVEGKQIRLCPTRPVADLSLRLRHPTFAWTWPVDGGGYQGHGAYRTYGSQLLPWDATAPQIELQQLDFNGQPAAWQPLIDIAVVYGRDVDRFREGWRRRRLDDWDPTYFLHVDSTRRWVNDPQFRQWLFATVDRRLMASLIFGGHAEPARLISAAEDFEIAPPQRRPFSKSSRPRLTLGYPQSDPLATAVAARLRAELDSAGVELRLEADGASSEKLDLRLHVHYAWTGDPVVDLLASIGVLDEPDAARTLSRASGLQGRASREERAAAVEARLVEGARRILPLVQVHTWLVSRSELDGLQPAERGRLGLQRVRVSR